MSINENINLKCKILHFKIRKSLNINQMLATHFQHRAKIEQRFSQCPTGGETGGFDKESLPYHAGTLQTVPVDRSARISFQPS